MHRIAPAIALLTLLGPGFARGESPHDKKIDELLAASSNWPGVIRCDIGVTRQGTSIPCLISTDDLDYGNSKLRILIVGGLDGSPDGVRSALRAMEWFYTSDQARRHRERFAVSAVPVLAPDAWARNQPGGNGSGGSTSRGYPPSGKAYGDPKNPEAAYLWRWVGMHAPDLVVVLESGSSLAASIPEGAGVSLQRLAGNLPGGAKLPPGDDLASQLVEKAPGGVGSIPALRLNAPNHERYLANVIAAISRSDFETPSPARLELQRRQRRSSVEIAKQLARHYGHELNNVAYIPALALIGRIRLGELTGDRTHTEDVERIVAPYVQKEKSSLGDRVSGSTLSGHLVFGELARLTSERRYLELAKAAADQGFDEHGNPKQVMPYHHEMSDSVFMGTPILVQVGRLTGQKKYFAMALRHLRFMLDLNLRDDGLHRHSPLDQTAWGRGNGFPALGLALSLSDLPKDHDAWTEMLSVFQRHLEALSKHQDPTGMWHQVIDHKGSYRELSCTCMITFAMIRGVRNGWLDGKVYGPRLDRAFNAIKARIDDHGNLVDVCTGTGKQQNLRAYLDRTAILGRDPRGGAMALMVTTEMASWKQEEKTNQRK